MKKIRFIEMFVKKNIKNYFEMPEQIFIEQFLPQDSSYCIVDEKEAADLCFYSVQLKNENLLRDNEKNIMISIENSTVHKHYDFFKTFSKFGSEKTSVYIHNDISRIIETPFYKAIPTVYFRIQYFNGETLYE